MKATTIAIFLFALCLPSISLAAPSYIVPGNCNRYVEEIEKYNWDTVIALKIMNAESGCDPKATNSTDDHKVCLGSYGLMQISCDEGIIYDPAYNIKIAFFEKYKKGGWKRHWSVCSNGKVNCV